MGSLKLLRSLPFAQDHQHFILDYSSSQMVMFLIFLTLLYLLWVTLMHSVIYSVIQQIFFESLLCARVVLGVRINCKQTWSKPLWNFTIQLKHKTLISDIYNCYISITDFACEFRGRKFLLQNCVYICNRKRNKIILPFCWWLWHNFKTIWHVSNKRSPLSSIKILLITKSNIYKALCLLPIISIISYDPHSKHMRKQAQRR